MKRLQARGIATDWHPTSIPPRAARERLVCGPLFPSPPRIEESIKRPGSRTSAAQEHERLQRFEPGPVRYDVALSYLLGVLISRAPSARLAPILPGPGIRQAATIHRATTTRATIRRTEVTIGPVVAL